MSARASIPALRKLIEKLPPQAARALLGELGAGGLADHRLSELRTSLIRHLNGSRTQHARRLFTALYEPFLLSEDGLLEMHAPGALHRADIGALWTTLAAQRPLAALAAEVDRRMAALAEGKLIDDICRDGEGRGFQERLRRQALDILDGCARRGGADAFLQRVEAARGQLLRPVRTEVTPRRLTRDDLGCWRDALEHAPALLAHAAPEFRPQGLGERFRRCHAAVPASEGRWSAAWLLPLAEAYRARSFQELGRLFAALPPEAAARSPLPQALAARLGATCRATARALLAGDALAAEEQVDRLAGILRLHGELDLFLLRETGRVASAHVEEMVAAVKAKVLPGLAERVRTLAEARTPLADFDMVEARLACVTRWADALASDRMVWGRDHARWRRDLLDRLARTLKDTLKRGDDDGLRHAHVLRIAGLTSALGASLGDWMGPVDKTYIGLLTRRLSRSEPLSELEVHLTGHMAEKARAELARIRYWKDPDLAALVALAEARLPCEAARA
jgi:hypothetical protein